MEKYEVILKDAEYIEHIRKIEELEVERIFDRHNISHFLDVARIGMLINLTEEYGIEKDMIYAAALLHDVGRDVQYIDGTPHEKASVPIAKEILSRTEYSTKEIELILKAINDHRTKEIKDEKSLSGLIYRADKMSRPCYLCNVEKDCNWTDEKKNKRLIW